MVFNLAFYSPLCSPLCASLLSLLDGLTNLSTLPLGSLVGQTGLSLRLFEMNFLVIGAKMMNELMKKGMKTSPEIARIGRFCAYHLALFIHRLRRVHGKDRIRDVTASRGEVPLVAL